MDSEKRIEDLTRLFQGRYGLVVAAARRYAPSEHYVDDVVQQVYLEFVRGAFDEKWDLDADIGSLLFQIAKRKSQLIWREKRREQTRPFEELVARMIDGSTQSDEDETREQVEAELLALKHCLESLPPQSRAILEQYYFKGIDVRDIARERDRSESAIYKFFTRLRQKLRHCIEHRMKFDNHD